jgi:D-3-phosphoglycerate dehydrogenase
MKILIADKFEQFGVEQLQALTPDVTCEPALAGDELRRRVAEYQPTVLVVRSTKVTADVLAASPALKVVIRAGSGYDTIDVAAATQRGVSVANCPGMNAVAVAELAMGLILALDRRIPDNVADARACKWNKKGYSKARGLKGSTLGIIGAGRIGTEVAKRALAFEMNVLYTHLGRNYVLADRPHCRRVELDELLRRADYVTVHVPGGGDTKALIDERRLKMMKPTAFLINTSRASVIDEAALIRALKEGWLAGAATDVFGNEPPADGTTLESPLKDAPRLYCTHHIGASTEQAQTAVAEEVVRIVRTFKQTGQVINCVNGGPGAGAFVLSVHLTAKPGALARVFQHLGPLDTEIEELDHDVDPTGGTATAHLRLRKRPGEEVLQSLRDDSAHVLSVELIPVE